MSKSNFWEKLSKIQQDLKAPKNLYNSFGKYSYRSAESILEAVKPMLQGLVLTVSDEMVEVGGRIYVKATASITDGTTTHSVSAFARESEEKRGMDSAQVSGSTSSYARKYSLNGLFLIDDNKDADTEEFAGQEDKTPVKKVTEAPKAVAKTEVKKEEPKMVSGDSPATKMEVKEEKTSSTPAKKGWSSMAKKKEVKPSEDIY